MTSSIFFPRNTDILAYLKRANFSEQILYLLSRLNRDDWEFLFFFTNLLIIFERKKIAHFFIYKICSEKLALFKYAKI
jgi:hypothetical protein